MKLILSRIPIKKLRRMFFQLFWVHCSEQDLAVDSDLQYTHKNTVLSSFNSNVSQCFFVLFFSNFIDHFQEHLGMVLVP